jgi:hypothetical protein
MMYHQVLVLVAPNDEFCHDSEGEMTTMQSDLPPFGSEDREHTEFAIMTSWCGAIITCHELREMVTCLTLCKRTTDPQSSLSLTFWTPIASQ